MPVFDAIRKARLRADGTVMEEAYSSADQAAVEMADLANEVASDIASAHDWRALTRIATFVGDGVTTAFPPPADYSRMLLSADVDDASNWFWGYTPIRSVNEWLRMTVSGMGMLSPGGWIIIGNEFNFAPAPVGSAQFPYISKNHVLSESGTPKAAFTADDDEFALDERLLTLGLIWRWKAQKGMDYSEDMATYEAALAQAKGRDKGAYVVRSPRRSLSGALSTAYPWALG